jgi:hypothetical protein
LDCGYNEETGFYPTDEVRATYGAIERFFVLNYDEDHLDALPRLRHQVGLMPFATLGRNTSLNSAQILSTKTAPYGEGILELVRMIPLYNGAPPAAPAGPSGEYSISLYSNPYPLFTDTNNLSLVVFVHGPGFSIIFPGDLEKPGWRMLLNNPTFRAELRRVRIFVAAHHGRESGYCKEVFDHCTPDVVIISDEPLQYDTQNDCYAQYAKGIPWNGGGERRRVLTTRCDGHIRISTSAPGWLYWISAGS